jgi:2,3-bisphosphoglycerate-independent phosphoglycerate mutase
VIYKPGLAADDVDRFDEFSARRGVCGELSGEDFMQQLFL